MMSSILSDRRIEGVKVCFQALCFPKSLMVGAMQTEFVIVREFCSTDCLHGFIYYFPESYPFCILILSKKSAELIDEPRTMPSF